MKIRQERWICRFFLDISIDLMVIGKVDAHPLRLFKGAFASALFFFCYWVKVKDIH